MYVFCFIQGSLSTYTIEKVDGNSTLPSFVYCMQIALASYRRFFMLSWLFFLPLFLSNSLLMVFLDWIQYFKWGIQWGTIFTIAFSYSLFVLACCFDFSDHQWTWSTSLLYWLAAGRPISLFRSFYSSCGKEWYICVVLFPGLSTLNVSFCFGSHCEWCS